MVFRKNFCLSPDAGGLETIGVEALRSYTFCLVNCLVRFNDLQLVLSCILFSIT